MEQIIFNFFVMSLLISPINTQQSYSGNTVLSCKNNDTTGPSPAILYTCNGQNTSCSTFLIFTSQPPYNSVPSISALTSTNPSRLARYNNVTTLSVFPTGKEVIVPIQCSCLGRYYRANATYFISSIHESYFTIANTTYQGLSTCDSLERANKYGEFDLKPGLKIDIPLRCACPTEKQVNKNIKYLLTYPLFWKDDLSDLAMRFGSNTKNIAKENGLGENPSLFPFTTILIPLTHIPISSKTIIHTLYPPPAAIKQKKTNTKLVKIVVGSFLIVLIIVGFCFLGFCLFFKKKPSRGVLWEIKEGKRKDEISIDLREEIATMDQIRIFEFDDLENATDGFSSENKIKGSSVHKGFFQGETLAVKKKDADVSDEVKILNKIYHFNIEKLRGVCQHGSYFYLVYEYMENGSLREWLDTKISTDMDIWNTRIQIGIDIANGLHYLHSFAKPAYVHKNITSQNILLDGKLRAKIANFSLAKTTEKGKNSVFRFSTTIVSGTRGYIAPEYIKGQVSTNIDVYAYGVVLLELITGKEAVYVHEGREVLLSESIGSIVEKEGVDSVWNLIDPWISQNGGLGFVTSVVKLSLRCLRHDPNSRPSMGEVASTLSNIQIEYFKFDSFSENMDSINDRSD